RLSRQRLAWGQTCHQCLLDRGSQAGLVLVYFARDEDEPILPVHLPLAVRGVAHQERCARAQRKHQEIAPVHLAVLSERNKRAETALLRPCPRARVYSSSSSPLNTSRGRM